MIIVTADQRTPEWYAARLGCLTGSRAADMLATIKSGEAAARRDLRMQLVVERLTGQCQDDTFVNAAIQHGIDKEPAAFAAYEAHSGNLTAPCGFVRHDTLPAGGSPDGEVDHYRGIIELKCPKSATHLKYLRAQKVPPEYLAQITHNLWITGAEWCDFASFDDRFPAPLQLIVLRVRREDVDLGAYELAARLFLSECERECEAVRQLGMVAA